MYKKDLKEDLRLRLSTVDMDFLRKISEERGSTISECIRSIIGEYRRSLETIETLKSALQIQEQLKNEALSENLKKGKGAVHGDTKSNKHNLV